MTTTIALSTALKDALEDLQESQDEEFEKRISMNDVILHILKSPGDNDINISGYEQTLDEHVKVKKSTRAELKRIKENEGHKDYEAVIRARGGIPKRDSGEEPIDVGSLDR